MPQETLAERVGQFDGVEELVLDLQYVFNLANEARVIVANKTVRDAGRYEQIIAQYNKASAQLDRAVKAFNEKYLAVNLSVSGEGPGKQVMSGEDYFFNPETGERRSGTLYCDIGLSNRVGTGRFSEFYGDVVEVIPGWDMFRYGENVAGRGEGHQQDIDHILYLMQESQDNVMFELSKEGKTVFIASRPSPDDGIWLPRLGDNLDSYVEDDIVDGLNLGVAEQVFAFYALKDGYKTDV